MKVQRLRDWNSNILIRTTPMPKESWCKMSHMFTYDWEEKNKYNWQFEEINCVICGEKTKRILNHCKKKANKLTCGKQECTNALYRINNKDKYQITCCSLFQYI